MARNRYLLALGLVGVLCGMGQRATAAGFDDFISPVSNPVNFEDPRAATEVRPIFAYHSLSDQFVSGGGNAQVVALQARVAITDRLAIIATKDGYMWLDPVNHIPGVLGQKNGWLNLGFGAKYALLYDPEDRLMVTAGMRYEAPSGDRDVFQGKGSGIFNFFLSGAWAYKDLHFLGYMGPRVPVSANDSSFWDMSAHVDYQIGNFYPLMEFNWVQVTDNGRRLPIDQEGFDLLNLGSKQAAGGGVVTQAFGLRYRITDDLEPISGHKGGIDVGFTYETPLTAREDLFGWRVTSDMIFWMH